LQICKTFSFFIVFGRKLKNLHQALHTLCKSQTFFLAKKANLACPFVKNSNSVSFFPARKIRQDSQEFSLKIVCCV